MYKKNILNILNGQIMYDYFMRNHYKKDNIYIPFNEAMCFGEVKENIFSTEFNNCRCQAHNVTIKKYNQKTLKPLELLLKNKFTDIVLWFDDDMFCQINLLTILAYLDQINYRRNLSFNLVDHNFNIIDNFDFYAQGYNKIYKQVMLNKSMPKYIYLPVMEYGIKLYLEYIKKENEITKFIKQNAILQDNILVKKLIDKFSNQGKYGLGDLQYIDLIKKYRKNYNS